MFSYVTINDNFTCCSLSSVLVARFGRPSVKLRLTARLKAVTLLTGVFQRVVTLLNTPLVQGCFKRLTPVSTTKIGSVSMLLPSVAHCSKGSVVPLTVFRKVLVSVDIPIFMSFFYGLWGGEDPLVNWTNFFFVCGVNKGCFTAFSDFFVVRGVGGTRDGRRAVGALRAVRGYVSPRGWPVVTAE